jgi:antitoxin HicB
MAHRDASGTKPEGRVVGGAFHVAEPKDPTVGPLFSRRDAGRASRLYQEDAEDASGGSHDCKTPDERGDKMKKHNRHIGSSLDDFLKEEDMLEEARTIALKETLTWQVQKAMEKKKISKVEMARRMRTSRAALDRLLDAGNASVTLQTMCRAARAIGRDLRIELV